MRERNIAVAVILSVVTCGIYSLYWFIVLTDDIIAASEEHATSGLASLLLTIITCGIYGIYWAYRMGQLVQSAKAKHNMQVGGDSSLLYLILQLFGLNLVNLILMQNEMNKLVYA